MQNQQRRVYNLRDNLSIGGFSVAAQEILCNSLGNAFMYRQKDFSYEGMRADIDPLGVMIGGQYRPLLFLGEDLYNAIPLVGDIVE